jgi:hypothetical protein
MVRSGNAAYTIAAGQTLIGVVRELAQAHGVSLNGTQEMRLAQQLAGANGIDNADRVFPGQTLQLSSVNADLLSLQSGAAPRVDPSLQAGTAPAKTAAIALAASNNVTRNAPLGYDVRSPRFTPAAAVSNASSLARSASPASQANAIGPALGGEHPVLQQTLDRAVAKGFIPAAEKTAVYDKILQMAGNHRFSPDDFARMTLMESDGMNPRASNERCHGIIQFCDGPARGAATAGYAKNPKEILNLSVHSQLDLVGKYFNEVGLKNKGPAGLEDLYLSVLNPASRAENSATRPLNIPGAQARDLHVGGDTDNPITRQSIRSGLLQNAAARLREMVPARLRGGAQGAVAYAETQSN